jgi:hypothetical protein
MSHKENPHALYATRPTKKDAADRVSDYTDVVTVRIIILTVPFVTYSGMRRYRVVRQCAGLQAGGEGGRT